VAAIWGEHATVAKIAPHLLQTLHENCGFSANTILSWHDGWTKTNSTNSNPSTTDPRAQKNLAIAKNALKPLISWLRE
jgi:hypothetical protein